MKSLAAAIVLLPAAALANPRALPFTYTTDQLPEGQVEIEQYIDLDPVLQQNIGTGAHREYTLDSAWTTEIEIGLTNHLELGLYAVFVPNPGTGVNLAKLPDSGNGVKQRLRWALADPEEWPIDVSLYGEVAELNTEVEFEGKVLLQKRFGALRIAANLTAEYELYYSHQREFVLAPSAGITYEITPKYHLGLDSWMHSEYPMNPEPPTRTFGLGPAVYVGPAFMQNFGKLWWSVGAYVRVTDLDHTLQEDEPYGHVYFRSMLGYNL